MTRAIFTGAAAVGAAVALAGCGGGNTAATTAATTGGTRTQTTRTSTSFRVRVQQLEAEVQAAVKQLRNGNFSAAASIGGPLLSHCRSTVSSKLAPYATSAAQRRAVSHLRVSCRDIANAATMGGSGDLSKAKQLAGRALNEAEQAVRQLR